MISRTEMRFINSALFILRDNNRCRYVQCTDCPLGKPHLKLRCARWGVLTDEGIKSLQQYLDNQSSEDITEALL